MAKTTSRHRLVEEWDLPDWLQTEVERWRRANPELGTKVGAFGLCHSASVGFLDRVAGVVRSVSESGGDGGLPYVWPSGRGDSCLLEVCEVALDSYFSRFLGRGKPCRQHHVARVGFWVIDWTARQFRPRDRFPRIWLWQTY